MEGCKPVVPVVAAAVVIDGTVLGMGDTEVSGRPRSGLLGIGGMLCERWWYAVVMMDGGAMANDPEVLLMAANGMPCGGARYEGATAELGATLGLLRFSSAEAMVL